MARQSSGRSHPAESNPDDLVAIFGANLKAARLKAGLTQGELAERAGLLQQYVSLVETGKQNVTLTTAKALADWGNAERLRLGLHDALHIQAVFQYPTTEQAARARSIARSDSAQVPSGVVLIQSLNHSV